MEKDPKARLKEWLASGQASLRPLTFPQREIWENSPVAPGDPANHVCSYFEIRGPFTYELCHGAIQMVADRQEAMRTSFLPGKHGPVQVVRAKGETALRYREMEPSETTPEGLQAAMAEGFGEPFDLMRGPLYRMDMLRLGPDLHRLAFTIHHAVADGWTLGAFVADLCTAYILNVRLSGKVLGQIRGIRDSLPPVEMSVFPVGCGRARPMATRGNPPPRGLLETPPGRIQKTAEPDGPGGPGWFRAADKWVVSLPKDLTDATRMLARRSGATLFSTLLTAFQWSLFRWSGIDDLVVGTPVANRSKAAVRETMGYFAGVVPLRARVDPGRSFHESLRLTHAEVVEDFAHAMPFAELAAALGEPSSRTSTRSSMSGSLSRIIPFPTSNCRAFSTRLRTCATGTSRFDIGCELTEDGGDLELVWLHRPSVVPRTDVVDLDRLFRAALVEATQNPEMPLRSSTL